MDLVGHGFGPEGVPADVRSSLFALGAERSAGTGERVARLARAVPGVIVRAADADIIPPLSDYEPFWRREVPFLFLSSGRNRHYHKPSDTPERLDWLKIEATARWLERFVRETCADPAPRAFKPYGRADRTTLDTLKDVVLSLVPVSPEAEAALPLLDDLFNACDARGELPSARRAEVQMLIAALEARLA
jgi:hypothetical protein